jgi:putative glutamate/gamma-aminobutyrate antiporter
MALLTTTAVASIRGLATIATFGLASIFIYIVPALVFLIPTALVPAELGSGWKGGVFGWVKAAYGDRMGFFAIWQQWMQNVVWYPVVLSFFASALAYVYEPSLASNGLFVAVIILVVYWIATMIASRGIKAFTEVGSKGLLVGTIIPAMALVVLAIIFLATGGKTNITGTSSDWIPPWAGLGSIVLVVSNFLSYAGMEMNAVHVDDMEHPTKNYPKSLLLASALILLIFIPPTLAVAVGVPASKINLTQGVLQAFVAFFAHLGMPWGTAIMALLIVIGVLSEIVTWIPGPSRGLLMVGRLGYLPPRLQKTNAHGMQIAIMTVQGVIVSVLAVAFAIIPSVAATFWMLSTMAVQLYLLMYIVMFLAAMRLRKIAPHVSRGFKTPAMTFIASLGAVASVAALLIGFVEPTGTTMNQAVYTSILVIGIVVLSSPPFIIYHMHKPSWNLKHPTASDAVAPHPPHPKDTK